MSFSSLFTFVLLACSVLGTKKWSQKGIEKRMSQLVAKDPYHEVVNEIIDRLLITDVLECTAIR